MTPEPGQSLKRLITLVDVFFYVPGCNACAILLCVEIGLAVTYDFLIHKND